MAVTFRVNVTSLNLRTEPIVRPRNRLAVLPEGHLVTRISGEDVGSWWRVLTTLAGNRVEGFVASRFLVPEEESELPAGESGIRAVHLEEGRAAVTRGNQSLLAFPLGEPDRPERDAAGSVTATNALLRIVNYLEVDLSPRYQQRNNQTFCNVYACDYCYLAKVYLPRVWWTGSAIERLTRGEAVPARYGLTVGELNANSLLDWLRDFGGRFGWARTLSETELQDHANQGGVCLILAQRSSLNFAGHVSVVVPENGFNRGLRAGEAVTVPLQSQAGARNFRFGVSTGRWWSQAKFRDFAFWAHA